MGVGRWRSNRELEADLSPAKRGVLHGQSSLAMIQKGLNAEKAESASLGLCGVPGFQDEFSGMFGDAGAIVVNSEQDGAIVLEAGDLDMTPLAGGLSGIEDLVEQGLFELGRVQMSAELLMRQNFQVAIPDVGMLSDQVHDLFHLLHEVAVLLFAFIPSVRIERVVWRARSDGLCGIGYPPGCCVVPHCPLRFHARFPGVR